MALDANQLSSLQRLSAPGYNRAIGSGDTVPYTGATNQGGQQTAGDAVPATPGPSGQFGSATPGAAGAFDPNSFLNNLSAYMPMISQLLQASQPAVPSGQGNAQATPGAQAVNGISSADLGAMPIAGSPAPAGIATAPADNAVPAYGTPAFWNWYAAANNVGSNVGSGEGA